MSLTRTVALIGTTLAISGSAFGADDNDALAQIAELKSELAALKAQSGEQWLTEQRATEIRGLVQDVLADADTRTSLQGAGMVGGHDGNFFIASPDGNFRLEIGGLIEARWALNSRNGINNSAFSSGTNWGFEVSRARFDFGGHVIDDSWRYKLRVSFGLDSVTSISGTTQGGDPFTVNVPADRSVAQIDLGYVEKVLDNGFSVRAGQFKAPFLREELVEAENQLAVERSLLNEYFNQDRSVGVQGNWSTDNLRAAVFYGNQIGNGVFSAFNSKGSSALTNSTSFAVAARIEWMIAGSSFRQFDNFTSKPGEEFGAMVGGAVFYQDYNVRGNFAGAEDEFGVTIDASVEFGGANLYGAFIYGNQKGVQGTATDSRVNPYGFLVQGGIYVTPDVELFGRYEYGDLDTPMGSDRTKLNVVTVGANWFLSNNVRATFDLVYSIQELGAFAFGNADMLADAPGEDGQFAIRAQLQLAF